MKKVIIILLSIFGGLYIALCVVLYFIQERMIFFPSKLSNDYHFEFEQEYEEMNIPMQDGTLINGLLFKTDSAKGLIFYLHGNAGSLSSWGSIANTYTNLQYDLFIPDYRGYGKSQGSIKSQETMFSDNQTLYDTMKKRYAENKIIVIGYSIGSGLAAQLASVNRPAMLILQAPYYSLIDMMKQHYPFVPGFLLKYRLESNEYLKKCNMPVVIFHGDNDEVIDYKSSLKLKTLMKPIDTLITLKGQNHNGMTDNPDYKQALSKILSDSMHK